MLFLLLLINYFYSVVYNEGYCTDKFNCQCCNNKGCLDNYYYNTSDSTCYLCSKIFNTWCEACDENQCFKCKKGAYFNGFSCTQCCTNCESCIEDVDDGECYEGYAFKNYGKGDYGCHKCQELYGDSSLKCNQQNCTYCKTPEIVVNGLCKTCAEEYSVGCITCDEKKCTTCVSGYFFDGKKCVPCNEKFINCLYCDSMRCLKCGFDLLLYRKKRCIECSDYFDKTCVKCDIYDCKRRANETYSDETNYDDDQSYNDYIIGDSQSIDDFGYNYED